MASKTRFTHAKKAVRKISFTGKLEEWSAAEKISFGDGRVQPRGRHATVYTLWDDNFLYIAFDVDRMNPRAKVTRHDGEGLWLDDGVEFLIDPMNDGGEYCMRDDIAYHINLLNVVYDERGTGEKKADASWVGSAVHEVKLKTDADGVTTGYICEVGVPWVELGITPVEDRTVMGIDFCVNGTDDETGNYHYFDWAGLKLFHHPDGFGLLELVSGPL